MKMTDEQLNAKYQPNTYDPYLYTLDKIEWKIFGTLTFAQESHRKDSVWSEKLRTEDFNKLIEFFCKTFKLRRRVLRFYKTNEFGMSGQGHLHFLIAETGCEHLSAVTCAFALKTHWEGQDGQFEGNISPGLGTAKIEPYDETKADKGVKYFLKREYDDLLCTRRFKDDYMSVPLFKLALSMQTDPSLN